MFCSKCGTKNDQDARFCVNCGNALKTDVPAFDKKKNNLFLLAIVAGIVLISLLITGGYFIKKFIDARNEEEFSKSEIENLEKTGDETTGEDFKTFRRKEKIASAVSTMGSVRGAFASYAADSPGNLFPPDYAITSWASLAKICNENGATLRLSEEDAGFSFISYDRKDSDRDGKDDTYELVVKVIGVPGEYEGGIIFVSPQGVFKRTVYNYKNLRGTNNTAEPAHPKSEIFGP